MDKQSSLLYAGHLPNIWQATYLYSTTFAGKESYCDV